MFRRPCRGLRAYMASKSSSERRHLQTGARESWRTMGEGPGQRDLRSGLELIPGTRKSCCMDFRNAMWSNREKDGI
jgi:hypothetical protein